MRRVLVATAIATILLTATGCSDDRNTTAGPTPVGTTAGGPTNGVTGTPGASNATGGTVGPRVTATAGGNAKEVCAAAVSAGSQAAMTFVAELSKQLQATAAGDTRTAEQARRNAEAALAGWARALNEQSVRATDPQLKVALADVAAEVATLKPDIERLDQTKLDQLQQRVDALCGG